MEKRWDFYGRDVRYRELLAMSSALPAKSIIHEGGFYMAISGEHRITLRDETFITMSTTRLSLGNSSYGEISVSGKENTVEWVCDKLRRRIKYRLDLDANFVESQSSQTLSELADSGQE